MTRLRWGAATDAGRARASKPNQDSYLLLGDLGLFAVADGMGGHQGGEVASRTAIEALEAAFAEPTVEGLVDAVKAANAAVFEDGSADPSLHGMGTTMVAIALVDVDGEERIATANVGDSRIYLFHNGELDQSTDDHSLVAEMVREGRLSPEEAENHPQRNIVTRVLGIYEQIDVDHDEVLPYDGQRWLLCSDGLFNEVSADQIAAVLRRLADPSDAARELVRVANEGGGRDNITVVVVDVVDDGGQAEAASAALGAEASRLGSAGDLAGFSTALGDDELEQAFAPSDEPAKQSRRERRAAKGPKPRRFTWRVVLFTLVILAILGAAAGATAWYARGTYYVAFDGEGHVAIFKGRPGGLLWFDPTLEQVTVITKDQVPAAQRDALESGKDQATLDDAERYVANLQDQITTTTTTTTTTTAPPPVTTAPPAPN